MWWDDKFPEGIGGHSLICKIIIITQTCYKWRQIVKKLTSILCLKFKKLFLKKFRFEPRTGFVLRFSCCSFVPQWLFNLLVEESHSQSIFAFQICSACGLKWRNGIGNHELLKYNPNYFNTKYGLKYNVLDYAIRMNFSSKYIYSGRKSIDLWAAALYNNTKKFNIWNQ